MNVGAAIAAAVLIGATTACAPLPTSVASPGASGTAADSRPEIETSAGDEGPTSDVSPGMCTGWAGSYVADVSGGAATAIEAARTSSGSTAADDWVTTSDTSDHMRFTSTGPTWDAHVTVSRLRDGTWMAMEGGRCTRTTGPAAITAVIEDAALVCTSPHGFGVRTRVRWAPSTPIQAWLYDDGHRAIGSQQLVTADTTIGVPSLIPVDLILRMEDGTELAERSIDPFAAGVHCH